ncbi:MAG: Ig-like domain-containing protein [Myxococcota bacterium]
MASNLKTLVAPALALVLTQAACGRDILGSAFSDNPFDDAGSSLFDAGLDGSVKPDGGPDGGLHPDAGPAVLKEIRITPARSTLLVGTGENLIATGVMSDGSNVDITARALWATDRPDSLKVDGGRADALAAGTAIILASLDGITGTAVVEVRALAVVQIIVSPVLPVAPVGAQIQFFADGVLEDGSHQDLTASVRWTTDNPRVATILPGGLVTTLSAGDTNVVAVFGMAQGFSFLTVTSAQLVGIQLSPLDPTMAIGDALPLVVTGIFSDGTSANVSSQATIRPDDPSVVSVDPAHVAHALREGSTLVTAVVQNFSATTNITVSAATLTSVMITPPSATLSIMGQAQFRAIGTFSDGTMRDVTLEGAWSTGDPRIATVDAAGPSAGLVTGISAGGTELVVTFPSGIMGAARLVVSAATLTAIQIIPSSVSLAVGATVPLQAIGTFSDGSRRDISLDVTWAIDDPRIAAVSNTSGTQGQISGLSAGMTVVRATLDGVSGSAPVQVTGSGLISIDVAPANAQTTAGVRSNYTATGHFSDGSTVDLTTSATWTTADSNVATISNVSGAQGQLLARNPGTTSVVATFMGLRGSTQVTVVGATLTQLTINPVARSVPVGTMLQFTAVAIFSNGTQQNVTLQSSFSSSNAGVATVSMQGQASAIAPGVTTVQASFMGLTAQTTLTVTNAVIVSISVTPPVATLIVGGTQNYTAVAIMSDGTQRNIGRQVTWQSSDMAIAQIGSMGRARGQATAIAPGTVTITASFQGVSGTASLTVTNAQIVQIQISPFNPTLVLGGQQQLVAVALFSDGRSQTITGQATWVSSSPQIAAVSTGGGGPGGGNRGLVTAIAPGTATINATFMGITGSTQVTVSSATILQIQVTPFLPTLPLGFDLSMRATAILSDGSTMDITLQATWTSDNPMVAPVSTAGMSKGLVTAAAPGTSIIHARFLGAEGNTVVTVSPDTLVSIDVQPTMVLVPIGGIIPLVAMGTLSSGMLLDVTELVTWQSQDPMVADVSNAAGSRGQVTGFARGNTVITASRGMIMGRAAVAVP